MRIPALFRSVIMVCALAAFGAAAPASSATAKRTGSHAIAKDHVSDSQIESTLRAKLAKSKVGKDQFTFKVKGGVVTWEGKTDVAQHKGAATRMAHSAGATGVQNNIMVSDAGRAKAAKGLTNAAAKRAQVTH